MYTYLVILYLQSDYIFKAYVIVQRYTRRRGKMQFGDHSPVDCGVFHKNTLALWQERENTVKSTTTIKIMKLGLFILRGSILSIIAISYKSKMSPNSGSFFQPVSLKPILRLNYLLGIFTFIGYATYHVPIYDSYFSYPFFYPFHFKFSGYDHNSFHRLIFFYNRTGMRIFFYTTLRLATHKIKLFMKKICIMYF